MPLAYTQLVQVNVEPKSRSEWKHTAFKRPGSELSENSMRARWSLFTQPAPTVVQAVTRFLILA